MAKTTKTLAVFASGALALGLGVAMAPMASAAPTTAPVPDTANCLVEASIRVSDEYVVAPGSAVTGGTIVADVSGLGSTCSGILADVMVTMTFAPAVAGTTSDAVASVNGIALPLDTATSITPAPIDLGIPNFRTIDMTSSTPGVYTFTLTVAKTGEAPFVTTTDDYAVADVLTASVDPEIWTVAGEPYTGSAKVTVAGGIGPYTYLSDLTDYGITIDPTTGAISGTPNFVGDYDSLQIGVTDSYHQGALSNNFAFHALGVTGPDVLRCNTGADINTDLLVEGNGNHAVTWAVTGGSLYPGVVLDPATGHLSGTPTACPVGNVTFTVTDTVTGLKATGTWGEDVLEPVVEPGTEAPAAAPAAATFTAPTATLAATGANESTLPLGVIGMLSLAAGVAAVWGSRRYLKQR